MQGELALPAFQMDCRDWLVITPSETGLPDEVAGTPLLAVLSTVVLDADDFRSVSAVLTVGLYDEDEEHGAADSDGWAGDAVDTYLDTYLDSYSDFYAEPGADRRGGARYVVPTPDGQLALLAEFTVTGTADIEINRRIEALMASFRWAG
jgi:hypothetical protein